VSSGKPLAHIVDHGYAVGQRFVDHDEIRGLLC